MVRPMNGFDESNDEEQPKSPPRPAGPPPLDKDLLKTVQDFGQELANMLEEKTGRPVMFRAVPFAPEPEQGPPSTSLSKAQNTILAFSYTPQEIKEHLDQYVIGQDEAKKALAIAICDHYVHLKALLQDPSLAKEHYQKPNILLLGPSGVGKTYLIKTIAQLIGVPLVTADANRFTEAGFVGANAEDLVRDLVQMANGDLDLAKYGIIYLDEVDKIAGHHDASEISRRGVQNSLLKLMEETEIDLLSGHDMFGQMQELMEFQKTGKVGRKIINTKYMLFIVSGAFEGLDDIIKRRCHLSTINLVSPSSSSLSHQNLTLPVKSTTPGSHPTHPVPSWRQKVIAQDLINYGLSPEFVGRLPVRVSCHELSAPDYSKILRYSRGSILQQYRTSFSHYHIEISFSAEAIDLMAAWAAQEKTGARALVTVGDRILREFKFILPSLPINYFVVTPNLMQQPQLYLDFLQKNPRAFDRINFQEIVGQSISAFNQSQHRSIHFTPEALSFLYQYRRARPPLEILIPKLLTVWQAEHPLPPEAKGHEKDKDELISPVWLRNSWELWHGQLTSTASTFT